MMLYQDLDFGLGREQRTQMRREVEQNRLEAHLSTVRPGRRAGLDEAAPRKGLAARSAAVVMTLFR